MTGGQPPGSDAVSGVAGQLERAQALLDLGRPGDAYEVLRALLAEDPQNVPALGTLAILLVAARKPVEAVAVLDQALGVAPEEATLWELRSRAQLDRGDVDAATAAAAEAIRLDPENAVGHLRMAEALSRREAMLSDAYQSARHAVHLDPQGVRARCVAGAVAELRGHLDEAAEWYRSALAVEPGHADALNALGALLMNRPGGRWQRMGEALRAFASGSAHSAHATVSRQNIEITLWNLASLGRQVALWCFLVGLVGALVSAPQYGDVVAGGALLPRLTALGVILASYGGALLWLRRHVPPVLRPMLLRVLRHKRPIRWKLATAAWPAVAGAGLVALPWAHPVVPALALLSLVVVPIGTVTTRRALRRSAQGT